HQTGQNDRDAKLFGEPRHVHRRRAGVRRFIGFPDSPRHLPDLGGAGRDRRRDIENSRATDAILVGSARATRLGFLNRNQDSRFRDTCMSAVAKFDSINISWRVTALAAAVAVLAFHVAYAASSLSFCIGLFLASLYVLRRAETPRKAFYAGLVV